MVKRDLLGTKLYIESDIGKAFNMDTIILSDFVRVPKDTKSILDFGTGNGAIMLYLSQRFSGHITGIELQEKRYELAVHNIKLNNLESRLDVVNMDLKTYRSKKHADIIVSNPPFFKVNNQTKQSIDMDMQIAKHEIHLNLETLIEAKFKGKGHLIVEPPLIQYKEKGIYSDEMQSIYDGRMYHK
ncbi:tRNA1(Val) (adenine(37)-N6)-methyltransferase [Acholeplasma laidlawii]|uniref:tRNA1(Val) (adenine(37)-N6)-methyltransferase n=1 Tax=Acholeplasma laidlawii TaxID=2148 RepID=UPI000B9860EC|nr:methyltransferase [Acholeplasma laidlawii]PII04112.1 hypothetical protein B9P96_003310 [Acholeplasma laidlawii]